jgi:hypothetical protein
MMATWADITKAQNLLEWSPTVSLEEGIKNTVEWTSKKLGLDKRCKTLIIYFPPVQ